MKNAQATSPIAAPAPTSGTPPGPVLLFDGVCNFCNNSVQFVLRHERAPTLVFAALQSNAAATLLARHGMPPAYLESIVLIEDGRVFTRSDAALGIARHLRAPWSWVRIFRWLPRGLRDWAYDLIARNRYRWFGKREEACLLPSPALRKRFLG